MKTLPREVLRVDTMQKILYKETYENFTKRRVESGNNVEDLI